jgi:glycosyltransferase involved in cell wall biosynthesis
MTAGVETSMKKILYISTRMPALSMTWIDREIKELRHAGYEVRTVSRGSPNRSNFSDETLRFYEGTLYLDRVGVLKKLLAQAFIFVRRPSQGIRALLLLLREKEVKGASDRVRLLHHLLQAGYVYLRMRKEGLSHIHAHLLGPPASIALFLSVYLGIPFSFTMHASNIWTDPLMLGTKLLLCRKAVTISRYNKEYLVGRYGTEMEDKIHIIHCGIDPDIYHPGTDRERKRGTVLSVGRLYETKGFRYLLEACRILKEKGVSFRCLVAGDGEEREMLKAMSAEYGTGDLVTFLGGQTKERVLELLREASLFVLPSIVTDRGEREGIPVSIMEAMAMELPVVTTRTVGIPELVEDGIEGLLVEQRNPDQLASALEFLLGNEEVREEMGRRGRLKIIGEFNIHQIPELFFPVFN